MAFSYAPPVSFRNKHPPRAIDPGAGRMFGSYGGHGYYAGSFVFSVSSRTTFATSQMSVM